MLFTVEISERGSHRGQPAGRVFYVDGVRMNEIGRVIAMFFTSCDSSFNVNVGVKGYELTIGGDRA